MVKLYIYISTPYAPLVQLQTMVDMPVPSHITRVGCFPPQEALRATFTLPQSCKLPWAPRVLLRCHVQGPMLAPWRKHGVLPGTTPGVDDFFEAH